MNAEGTAGNYRFGEYIFDPSSRVLSKSGRSVELTARASAALGYFLDHAGETVTKECLLAAVWPQGCVETANVAQTIYLLRRTFKLAGDDNEIIATVPGGYRFLPAIKLIAVPKVTRATRIPLMPLRVLGAAAGLALAIGLTSVIARNHREPPTLQVPVTAHAQYEEGRFYWNRRTPANLTLALHLFQSAVRLDPRYAEAYSGIADTYTMMGWRNPNASDAGRFASLALDAVHHGLALDPKCGECYASIGFIDAWVVKDRTKAEREFRTAIRLDPSYATAHEWYAWFLFYTSNGKHEALAEMERAAELDPTSSIIKVAYGWQLFYLHQYGRAAAEFADASRLDQKNDGILFGLALAQEQLGNYAAAVFAIDEANRISRDPMYDAERGRLLAKLHRRSEAEATIRELSVQHPSQWYSIALVYDALDQRPLAIHYLKLAYKFHDVALQAVAYDPRLDDLRPYSGD